MVAGNTNNNTNYEFSSALAFQFCQFCFTCLAKKPAFFSNKAFTSIFYGLIVSIVRYYLLHNFSKCYWVTVKKNKIEDKIDLLKKEGGKREAFRKDFKKIKCRKTSLKYVINKATYINSVISRAAVTYWKISTLALVLFVLPNFIH